MHKVNKDFPMTIITYHSNISTLIDTDHKRDKNTTTNNTTTHQTSNTFLAVYALRIHRHKGVVKPPY
jgi:hypothetical protein